MTLYSGFITGSSSVILVKFDSWGNLIWQRGYGGGVGYGIAVDSSGDIYLAGVSGYEGAGGCEAMLLKVNSTGDPLWYRDWGGYGCDVANNVALDAQGNLYVEGTTGSFVPNCNDNTSACANPFLLIADSSGNLLWDTVLNDFNEDLSDYAVGGFAVSSAGNIYATTSYTQQPLFGHSGNQTFGIVNLDRISVITPQASLHNNPISLRDPNGTISVPAGVETAPPLTKNDHIALYEFGSPTAAAATCGQGYTCIIESGSQISGATFNGTSLSFLALGAHNSIGYLNLTFPKTIVNVSQIQVTINGIPLSPNALSELENSTSEGVYFTFEYRSTEHIQVRVSQFQVAAPNPGQWISTYQLLVYSGILLTGAVLVAVVIVVRRRSAKLKLAFDVRGQPRDNMLSRL